MFLITKKLIVTRCFVDSASAKSPGDKFHETL